ncbi:MAG TPA: HEAT repeat domain-containing protein [Gemmatimonadaceae bacterium]|nr:HEAT repeat domain-containing protein [Gemmatimonadaceae bacterium]
MISNFFAGLSDFTASNIAMIMLLAKATIILLLALGITVVMQRASAGARHLVWLVTVAALLFVPALTAWAPLPVRILPAVRSFAEQYSPIARPRGETSTRLGPAHAADDSRVAAFTAVPGIASRSSESGSPISESTLITGISALFILWAAVLLVIAASLGYAALLVKRIVNRARPLDTADWLNPLWEVSDRLALEEPPRLLRSEDAKMPFACGLLTPTIVLPAESDHWSLDRRRAVLLHELAHVRRHDLIGHTLGRLACAVYWFHPLVWKAAKQLRSESERACDDLALACGARATDYAEHLLDIVTSVRGDATPSVALAMARRKEFEGRMLAILDPELRHSSPNRKQSAALIGSLALISIIVGAAAPAPRQASQPSSPSATARGRSSIDLADRENPSSDPKLSEHMDALSMHVNTQTSTSVAQQVMTSTSEHISQSTSATLGSVVGPTVDAVVGGAAASVSASPQALLKAIIAQGQRAADKDSDERPALLAKVLATDTSVELRRIAAWGLSEYADRQVAADALANALRRDSDASVREMAAWSLAEADRSSAGIAALIAALRADASVKVRETAAWALGSAGDRSAGDALAAALSDASPEVRKRAAWALGNADVRQAPPALVALLRDNDPEVRELAAWSLYQIEDPAAIPALQSALHGEQNKDLQIAYIRALAATGEKSVDALKELLESRDPKVKAIAVRALAGGNATGPWPWPWPEPRPFPN